MYIHRNYFCCYGYKNPRNKFDDFFKKVFCLIIFGKTFNNTKIYVKNM